MYSVEPIHESVESLIIYYEAIGIDCAFKNNSLSPFNFNNFLKINLGISVVYIPTYKI